MLLDVVLGSLECSLLQVTSEYCPFYCGKSGVVDCVAKAFNIYLLFMVGGFVSRCVTGARF